MPQEPGWRPKGSSTRAVHAGLPPGEQGAPFLPGPFLASATHLAGEAADTGYGRYSNPTWSALESALGDLEGGDALVFSSGMAAITAVLYGAVEPGDAVVIPSDGYGLTRTVARRHLDVREVPTHTEAIIEACDGARMVWVETPSNPRLDVCDLRAVVEAAHAAGAVVVVDNTLATPLGQQPLALGADISVTAGTKSLAGHSDLLLGVVAGHSLDGVREWRSQTGAVAGPFEAWLAHRSLATLDLRLARQSDSALAIAEMLSVRDDVEDVCHPSFDPVAARQMTRFGSLVSFDLGTEDRAQRFLAACSLVSEATSFGGVHTTAERRARWGTDDVGPGFVRLSAGVEDTEDLLADVAAALDAIA